MTDRGTRLMRFSLRVFLVVIVLLAVVLGLGSLRIRKQRQFVSTLQQMGGYVEYAHEVPPDMLVDVGGELSAPEPPGPVWLRNLIGDELFFSVRSVHLPTDASDDDVTSLKPLDTVEELWARSQGVSDDGLAMLAKYKRVRRLDLEGAMVTDRGVKHLLGLPNLESLDLSETQITDEALATLGTLKQLRHLDLSLTTVTDEGLSHLTNLSNLESLRLNGTYATDEKLKALRSLMPAAEILCVTPIFSDGKRYPPE